MFNGFDEMAMTNLDGYDKCPEIKITTGYDLDGEILAYPPATVDEWERCKPVYETVPGWMQDIFLLPFLGRDSGTGQNSSNA